MAWRGLAAGALMMATTLAGAADGEAAAAKPEVHRFVAKARLEPAARQAGGRFTLRARLAREASAGELREGGRFVAIGRFSKAAQACGGEAVFANGFE